MIVNVAAGQDKDLPQKTEDLITKYCTSNKDTLLLCITKANDDLANCQGYRITTQVDPTGARSMGVLTKSDLAKSEHVRDMIENQDNNDVSFKHNWTAVINRNKKEEDSGMSIAEKVNNS